MRGKSCAIRHAIGRDAMHLSAWHFSGLFIEASVREEALMKVHVVCVALCLTLLATVSFAAAHEYQLGKVVKVEKRESNASAGGTDAPVKTEVATYLVSIQLADKVYICRYKADQEDDPSWTKGRDFQARVSGKTMYVKRVTGKETKGAILSTSPASNQ
jgi:hypothetical protein